MNFCIDLNSYRGPLDLLLYLVRKHEVEIVDIPIAAITAQYLEYMDVLQQLDVNAVGDFLDMASSLIELKSKLVLPQVDEETEEIEDPREELVQRLLEYKKYKDAASILEEQSLDWQQRFVRQSNDLPPRTVDLSDQPIREVELWDLVSALGRIVRDSQKSQPKSIVYDETPLHVYMKRIHDRIVAAGEARFSEMFEPGMHKSAMVGVFLAILELVRHHGVLTEQSDTHGEIRIFPGEVFKEVIDLSNVSSYEQRTLESDEMPVNLK